MVRNSIICFERLLALKLLLYNQNRLKHFCKGWGSFEKYVYNISSLLELGSISDGEQILPQILFHSVLDLISLLQPL